MGRGSAARELSWSDLKSEQVEGTWCAGEGTERPEEEAPLRASQLQAPWAEQVA